MGLQGVIRGRTKHTTIPADRDKRPLDLVRRRFRANPPKQHWVADFTYIAKVGVQLCRVRHRCVIQDYSRLPGLVVDGRRPYSRRFGAGPLGMEGEARHHSPVGQGIAIP